MKLTLLFVILFSIACQFVYAQSSSNVLNECKTEAANGHYKKAFRTLKPYAVKHPEDFDMQWFAAKLAYWNWDVVGAKTFYKKALALKKEHLYVRLDYAKMLVDIGDYGFAIQLLKQYIQFDKWSADAQLYYIKAQYYSGNLTAALDAIHQMPDYMQQGNEVAALKKEIRFKHGYNLLLANDFVNDDQPLKTISPSLNIGRQHSALLNWQAAGSFQSFQNDVINTNAHVVELSNKMNVLRWHQQWNVHLGMSSLSKQSSETIGGIEVQQSLLKHFSLGLEAERKPYFYSLASTQTAVVYNSFATSLSTNDFKKFSGKLQLQQQQFDDKNAITNASVWLLSPSLNWKWLSIKAGYSYQSSNATINHYAPTISIDSFLTNYDSTRKIPGVYSPYFTPANQTIHAALLWLEMKPSKKLVFTVTANFTLSASLDNPYFFLNKDNNNNVFFDKGFVKQTYQPAHYKADLSFKQSKQWQLGLGFEYLKTNYYEANYFHCYLSFHGI